MFYRDYEITNKWWKKKLAINVNGKEILFDNIDELINNKYESGEINDNDEFLIRGMLL